MVNVDTVYQRVLAFANKEQRGYITPQEFNLFANQAQMEILNQYFYDLNQFGRQHGNDTEYSDMLSVLQEKLSELEVRIVGQTVAGGIFNHRAIGGLYKLGSVIHNGNEVEEVNNNEWHYMESSPLTRPTISRPVYVNRTDGLNIYPSSIATIDISYIRRPNNINWGYIVVNETALYDPTNTVNFDLHQSEESELVLKILKFSGISIMKEDVVNAAQQLETSQTQQEKQ
mgnify:CR=1 FL=1